MKYIKKFFIRLVNLLTGYTKLKTKYNVRLGEFDSYMILVRSSECKIYLFRKDGSCELSYEKNVKDVFARENIVVAKSLNGYTYQFVVYDLEKKYDSISELRSYVSFNESIVGIKPFMGLDKYGCYTEGFGNILYELKEKNTGYVKLADSSLNTIMDRVVCCQFVREEKRNKYLLIAITKNGKFKLYNDYGMMSKHDYDMIDSIYSDYGDYPRMPVMPLMAIWSDEEGNKEYNIISNDLIKDWYMPYECVCKVKKGQLIKVKMDGLWGLCDSQGRVVVSPEYKSLQTASCDRFFARNEGSIHLYDIYGKDYVKPYKTIHEDFEIRQYGIVCMVLAVVEDWDGIFYIDIDGKKYEMFEPYERPEYPFFDTRQNFYLV